MTDFCEICLTEAVDLDDWFLKVTISNGKLAIIECICPWCEKEMISIRLKIQENEEILNDETSNKEEGIEFVRQENLILRSFVKVE